MKKLLVFFTIVLLVSLTAFGQWEVVKQGDELLSDFKFSTFGSGFMLDVNTGWYVGNDGLVIKTIDGGASWATVRDADDSGVDWDDVEFVDANTGYTCGTDGFIFKTTDGGANWTMIGDTANYKVDFSFLKVIDANTAFFAGDDAVLLKTTDGGANFVKSDNTFEGQDLDGGIDFCSANVGVVASDDNGGYTWYTHDGGNSWNVSMINALTPSPFGVTKFNVKYVGAGDDSTIVLGTKYRVILISQDGGKSYTWKGDYTLATDYYYAVSVIDENTFFLGGDGLTVRTTDGGANWDSLNTGTGQEIVFMNFIDANNGFIFATYNQWMKTTDGGDTFSPILDWPSVLYRGIGATSSTIFVTAFAGGEITSSSDGGTIWTYPTNLSTDGIIGNLDICEFFDDNNGIIVGPNGNLIRTTDGGTSWTFIDNPMYVSGKTISALAYYSTDTVFAGGSSGYLMRSVDGGLTWSDTYLSVTTKAIYGILPIDGKTVLACGQSGYLYKAEFVDAATVDDSLYATGTDDDFNAIVSHADSIFLLSDEGNLFKTSLNDLDSLTQTVVDDATDEMNDIVFVDDTLAFIVGKSGKIYRSEDAGMTWTAETSPTTENIYSIIYFNYALWVTGGSAGSGVIIKLQLEEPAEPITGIVINEFLASNDASCTDENGDYDDYIELYNAGEVAVDIGGLYVTDDLSDPTAWQIPDTNSTLTTIQPGGFLVLWADKESEQGVLHVDIKLSGDGEQIGLVQVIGSETIFIDSLSFGAQTEDISCGRYTDGSNNWMLMDPTPGAVNVNVVAIDNTDLSIPTSFALRQNYPNPFNPVTNISFDLPKDSQVKLAVFNMVGQQVAVLKNEVIQAGSYNIQLDASHLASGVYFYRIQAGDFTSLKKMILLK